MSLPLSHCIHSEVGQSSEWAEEKGKAGYIVQKNREIFSCKISLESFANAVSPVACKQDKYCQLTRS